MNSATYGDPIGPDGGISLRAAALTDVDEAGTAVIVDKGTMDIVVVVTALEVDTGDNYIIDIEANTRAATSTYKVIGSLPLGSASITGRDAADTTGTYKFVVENPYDYQIRTHVRLSGSIATGINFTAKAYPHVLG